ncbi:MAG: nucleotide exchange factor GrpE [Candidatus Micrarchaeota archaeon]
MEEDENKEEMGEMEEKERKEEREEAREEGKNASAEQCECCENLKRENAELSNHLKRLQAEFENYKKRVEKEKNELKSAGRVEAVANILTALDDVEAGVKTLEESEASEEVKKGVYMIQEKLANALRAEGVREIDALGKKVDLEKHEVMLCEKGDESETDGKILRVLRKGYEMNGRIIRHALVSVCKKEEKEGVKEEPET